MSLRVEARQCRSESLKLSRLVILKYSHPFQPKQIRLQVFLVPSSQLQS